MVGLRLAGSFRRGVPKSRLRREYSRGFKRSRCLGPASRRVRAPRLASCAGAGGAGGADGGFARPPPGSAVREGVPRCRLPSGTPYRAESLLYGYLKLKYGGFFKNTKWKILLQHTKIIQCILGVINFHVALQK